MQVPLLVTDFLRRAPSASIPNKTRHRRWAASATAYARFPANGRTGCPNALARPRALERGDRVCILSPNSHFFLESFYANEPDSGIILVPLNYRLVAADHEYILNHAGVKRRARRLGVHRRSSTRSGRTLLETVEHWIVAKDSKATLPTGWTRLERVDRRCERGHAPPPVEIDEKRPRLDQLHERHDGAPEGRHADAPQLPTCERLPA